MPPSFRPCPVSLGSSPFFQAFSTRAQIKERMDDPTAEGEQLRSAVQDLRRINRLLGGLQATATRFDPLFQNRSVLQVLDVGSGTGDHLAHLIRRGHKKGTRVEARGVDLNPLIVGYGRAWLDATLPSPLRAQARLETEDALHLPYEDNRFDVTHAALFLHHFHGPSAVQLLREMDRVSRLGVVVNDLHRHLLAYGGIWVLSRILGLSPMVQHDGPISVRRGFQRAELRELAHSANLSSPDIRWHWAFRWTCSTLS